MERRINRKNGKPESAYNNNPKRVCGKKCLTQQTCVWGNGMASLLNGPIKQRVFEVKSCKPVIIMNDSTGALNIFLFVYLKWSVQTMSFSRKCPVVYVLFLMSGIDTIKKITLPMTWWGLLFGQLNITLYKSSASSTFNNYVLRNFIVFSA